MLFQFDSSKCSSFTIRSAKYEDIEPLIKLRSIILDDGSGIYVSNSKVESDLWKKEYREWLKNKIGLCCLTKVVVAVNGYHEVVGCAIGIIDHRAPIPGALNGLIGWIQTVVVDPLWRNNGLASSIVDFLHKWFRDENVSRCVLQTTSNAESLYLGLGYKYVGEKTLYHNTKVVP